jgi:hypothetical protein
VLGTSLALKKFDWIKLEEKLEKKLDVWQGSTLSFGGRTVLINASLSNTPIYHMSMFIFLKTVAKRMDKMRIKKIGKGGALRRSITSSNGLKCVKPKRMVALESKTSGK